MVNLIESTNTASMEDVSTGLLEKNKEHLKSKGKAKNDMLYQDIYSCICRNTKKWRYTIQYVKPTAQLVFKNRFPKGGPTCRRQVVNPRHQTSSWLPMTWICKGLGHQRPWLWTNFSEILSETHTFSFKKMHLKMSPGRRRPFCLGLNILINIRPGEVFP